MMNPEKTGVRAQRAAVFSACAFLASACVEFTPFDSHLSEDERDQTAKNLRALSATDPPSATWRFAAIADSHGRIDSLCDVVEHLNGVQDLSFVIHLGDLSDVGLRQEYQWSLRCLRRLKVPFFAVIGNHDALSNGKAVYASMFGPLDYTVDYGGVRLACFNSNALEFDGYPDLNWLEEATAPSEDLSLVLGATHAPPAERGYAEVLRRNGASGVLFAHLHEFRSHEEGGLAAVSVDDAATGHYALVSVRADGIDVEACSVGGCAASGS